jgi:hypothetical protein
VDGSCTDGSGRLTDPDFGDVPMSCKSAGIPEAPIPPLGWVSRAGLAIALLFGEFVWSWCLFFNPGWANAWPFGVSFQTVLSVVITGWLALIFMTASAGLGAIIGFICALLRLGTKNGPRAYRLWLWTSGAVSLFSSIPLFARIHAWTMQLFPNGYLTP